MSSANLDHNVYIIIVTYNGMPWIRNCLERCGAYPIVVVDNASTDGTLTFIREHFPQVKVLAQETNLGFGQANNVGIKHAMEQGTDYVFLLNQDVYLQENCIEILLQTHSTHTEYGILSPVHLNGTGTGLDMNFASYVAIRKNPDFYSDFVLGNSIQEIYPIPFVNAAGWLLSKTVLNTVGGFDPIFFHYGEDDNYCQRVHYHGFKIGVVPSARLRHDREDRTFTISTNNDLNDLKDLERKLKILYGNINKDNLDNLKVLLGKREKALFRTRLKLKSNSRLEEEIRLLRQIIPELLQSRTRNMKKGPNYLKD